MTIKCSTCGKEMSDAPDLPEQSDCALTNFIKEKLPEPVKAWCSSECSDKYWNNISQHLKLVSGGVKLDYSTLKEVLRLMCIAKEVEFECDDNIRENENSANPKSIENLLEEEYTPSNYAYLKGYLKAELAATRIVAKLCESFQYEDKRTTNTN